SHHEVLAPERVREHSFEHQISTWNVGFMERLRLHRVWGMIHSSVAAAPVQGLAICLAAIA
ncbi:hypothetical protein ACXPVS_26930, partial [Pseudomonas sp. Ma2-10]